MCITNFVHINMKFRCIKIENVCKMNYFVMTCKHVNFHCTQPLFANSFLVSVEWKIEKSECKLRTLNTLMSVVFVLLKFQFVHNNNAFNSSLNKTSHLKRKQTSLKRIYDTFDVFENCCLFIELSKL